MLIIPAIDLKDGCVVRLVQGKYQQKIYSRDPAKTAKHWVKLGAEFLHIVDLDGAFAGKPVNLKLVKEIVKSVPIKIEFGGGIREISTIKGLLDAGVSRVVLGTRAIQDDKFLKNCFKKFKNKVIISLDANKEGSLCIKGWKAGLRAKDSIAFAQHLKEIGFKEIIFTDITKDGTLKGPNIQAIKKLLKETGLKVIASGGISGLDDIFRLKLLEKDGLAGIIIGKALYEARFTLPQALRIG